MIATFFEGWVFPPQFLASWLQAAAAVIALALSVVAIFRSDAVVRRRDQLEIKALVVAIYPEIQMLRISVGGVRANIEDVKGRYGHLVGQSVSATVQVSTYIPVPPMMDRNTDKLFILGDVPGPSCVHLVRLLVQYNSFAAQIANSVISMNAEQWVLAIDQLDEHLILLLQVLEKCQHQIQPIHDEIVG